MSDNRTTIRLPERFTLANIYRFARMLDSANADASLTLDFGPARSFPPSAMLLLYPDLQRFISRVGKGNINFINMEQHSYAAHIGFFKLIGVDYGRDPNSSTDRPTYVPIQSINVQDWLSDLRLYGVSEHVDKKCLELSAVLCAERESELFELVHYNMREIVRNIFEHAKADRIGLVAQCWPNLGKAQIAVCDNGVGIRKTVSRNKRVSSDNDSEALEAALFPGISGSDRLPVGDHWDNSGYGLFMTSEIGGMLGSFVIASGNAALQIVKSERVLSQYQTKGTYVSIEFQLDRNISTRELLANVASKGERISKQNFGPAARRASGSSRGC